MPVPISKPAKLATGMLLAILLTLIIHNFYSHRNNINVKLEKYVTSTNTPHHNNFSANGRSQTETSKTKSHVRPIIDTITDLTVDQAASYFKDSELKRVKSIKESEDETHYKYYIVINAPNDTERSRLIDIAEHTNDIYEYQAHRTSPIEKLSVKDGLAKEFFIESKGAYYLLSISIEKSNTEIGKYTSMWISEGNLSYDKSGMPCSKDFMNIINHEKPFTIGQNGRFSNLFEIPSIGSH